jgi:nucleoid DNA-binding protein
MISSQVCAYVALHTEVTAKQAAKVMVAISDCIALEIKKNTRAVVTVGSIGRFRGAITKPVTRKVIGHVQPVTFPASIKINCIVDASLKKRVKNRV